MAYKVVCFGDSITRGQVSANYLELLAHRLGTENYQFINAGVNNDLTYNLLHRIEPVIHHQPDYITLLVGTNDVISSISLRGAIYNMLRKRLPRWPVLQWSYTNLIQILWRLKHETHAKIGVASIPILGENLNSRAIRRVRDYNQSLREIVKREKVAYLPVFERQIEYLRSHSQYYGRSYQVSVPLTLELALRHLIINENFDTFSARKGYILLTDGVHMNHAGASIIADEIEKFLRGSLN